MQLSNASLYSILPSKYIIVRLNKKRGSLPTKTQLYLLFSDYADSFSIPYLEASIQGQGSLEKLKENPKEFYEDVKKLSESLYSITQPLAQQEVNEGGSNVSVIVRKYTDLVSTDFPKLNIENFQYIVAKRADEIEKGRGGYPHKGTVRKQLEELENDVIEIFYNKYFENGNPYLWRQFILEVNARLLSKLLLNVHARRED
jgi:hypothetical protein